MTPEEIQALAAVATFLAAALAVWATFKAPKWAAQFAENLRKDSTRSEQERLAKLYVFTTLMQQRAAIASPLAVSALNVIDVVFFNAPDVREAWRNFMTATEENPSSSARVTERYLAIIEKMTRDLGFSEKIRVSDLQTVYYPKLLDHLDQATFWEASDKLARFRPSEGEAPR